MQGNFGGSKKKFNESVPVSSVHERSCDMIMLLHVGQWQRQQKSLCLVGLFSSANSPNLAPLNYHLFPKLKQFWGDKWFAKPGKVESNGVEMVPDGWHAVFP